MVVNRRPAEAFKTLLDGPQGIMGHILSQCAWLTMHTLLQSSKCLRLVVSQLISKPAEVRGGMAEHSLVTVKCHRVGLTIVAPTRCGIAIKAFLDGAG